MGLKWDHGKLCASLGIPVLTFGFLLKWQSVRFEEHIKMPCKVETIKECCGDEIGQTKMGPYQGPWLQVFHCLGRWPFKGKCQFTYLSTCKNISFPWS